MVELNNGCVCCTINDLVEAVYKVERQEQLDYLVVETTLPIRCQSL